jgi:hypothetical protein
VLEITVQRVCKLPNSNYCHLPQAAAWLCLQATSNNRLREIFGEFVAASSVAFDALLLAGTLQ